MRTVVLGLLTAVATAADWQPEDFVPISGPASPHVAYAVARDGAKLRLAIETDGAAEVELGVAGAKERRFPATATRAAGKWQRVEFSLPASEVIGADGVARLRVGFAVAWTGGPFGEMKQRERFRHRAPRAAHAGLSLRSDDWLGLDLDEHARAVADRKLRLVVPLAQPFDGMATVAIDDAQGRRVRNLIGGQAYAKGAHEVTWDGCDDAGNPVPPGEYRWRSLHHPGLTLTPAIEFAAAPGTNHTAFTSAIALGDRVCFSAPVSEGGENLVALDPTGARVAGYIYPHGSGLARADLACDGAHVYVLHDGSSWGQHIDKARSDWSGGYALTIERLDEKTLEPRPWDGQKGRFVTLHEYQVGPGSPAKLPDRVALAGAVCDGSSLWYADAQRDLLVEVKLAGPAIGRTWPLAKPTALTVGANGVLIAASGGAIVRIDQETGAVRTLVAAGELDPVALHAASDGPFFVSDARSHTIRVFDANGKAMRTLGTPGGHYAGAYDPERLVEPRGLALAGGKLWVAEDRWMPKRFCALHPVTGAVLGEWFGPSAYGSSGAGMDPRDHTRWIAMGAQWTLDLAKGTAKPRSVLSATVMNPTHVRWHQQDGRIFLIVLSGSTMIGELMKDGSLKPHAVISSTHRYSFQWNWQPPQAFIDAFATAYPDRIGKHADKGPGFLWSDRDGDGAVDADEFDFAKASDDFAGAYWGNDQMDLTLRVPARVGGTMVMVTLKPDGWLPGGAPKYPVLDEACRAGAPIDMPAGTPETTTLSDGSMLVNSDPEMRCFASDGALRWTYPNRWSNVHGSHQAPLPRPGQLQGVLFFTGVAPLDETGEVIALQGNHGRIFFLTSDGMYVDEVGRDVRMGGTRDHNWIGGEAFGGSFARSAKDQRWYLQAGGLGYRVMTVAGLERVTRAQGTISVVAEQVAAVERQLARAAAAAAAPRLARIVRLASPPTIDGDDAEWTGDMTASWDRDGRFPVAVRAGWDEKNLYVVWRVQDPSPWRNGGKDWTTLFKTGDSVDLQLGADANAASDRSGPVRGDLRLLIAPHDGGDVAVLYRHRQPGADDGVVFQSPWRSERVDSVRTLTTATIKVRSAGDRVVVEAAIPLTDLGLVPKEGVSHAIDFGALYGDDAGEVTGLRSYWSNRSTGLVNDVPGEIMLTPNLWGGARFTAGVAP